MQTNNERSIKVSVYLKVLLNYSQMVSIITNGNFKWPYYIQSYLYISSILSSVSTDAFSIDCLLYDLQINESPIHIKALIFVILPFFIWVLVIILLTLKICLIKTRNSKELFKMKNLFTYFIICCNYLHPMILQKLFDNLKCKNLGGKEFIYMQMNFSCDSENHTKWVLYLHFLYI